MIYLLNKKVNGKVSPIVIALPLFESFWSKVTSRTGKVFIPLDGESILGYHAMLVVGYDCSSKYFLVRNSWSTRWAPENSMGYAGHAYIPYEYMRRFYMDGATIENTEISRLQIAYKDRLYYKILNLKLETILIGRGKHLTSGSRKAINSTIQPKKKRYANLLLKTFILAIIIYYFQEPILYFINTSFAEIEKEINFEIMKDNLLSLFN